MNVDALVRFYHELSPETVARLPDYYSSDAWFKDPFNEVRGVAAIQRIFTHMFEQLAEPHFIVTEQLVAENGTLLVWDFFYRVRLWGRGEVQVMRGVSHLKFDGHGKVCYHRDYWDTGEELYMKVPVLGVLMRVLRRVLAA